MVCRRQAAADRPKKSAAHRRAPALLDRSVRSHDRIQTSGSSGVLDFFKAVLDCVRHALSLLLSLIDARMRQKGMI